MPENEPVIHMYCPLILNIFLEIWVFFLLYFYIRQLKEWRLNMSNFHIIKKLFIVSPLLLAFSISTAFASEYKQLEGTNKLSAHIVMSHSPGFIGSWLAENKTQELPGTKVQKVEKDKRFFAAFLAKGLEGNHADRYRFDVDWKLYKPDGTVMFSEESYARGSGPVQKEPKFSLAYPTLYIVLDKTDPPGKYKLEAVVKDQVTETSAIDSYHFDFGH